MMQNNVVPIRRPSHDSEITEIVVGDYVARRRVFAEGSSYLTIVGPDGSVLFVSKDVQNVCIPSLITAYRAGVGRGRKMAEAAR